MFAKIGGVVGGMFGGPVGSAVGTALGGAIDQNRRDKVGQEAATTAFERQQILRQTSYQDTMADLRAAGLNPMLAFSQGPTGTPGVSQANLPSMAPASMQAAAAMTQADAATVSSAASASQAETARKQMESNVKLQEQQTKTEMAKAGMAEVEEMNLKAIREALVRTGDPSVFRMDMAADQEAVIRVMKQMRVDREVNAAAAEIAERQNQKALQDFINAPATSLFMQVLQGLLRGVQLLKR